MSEPLNVRLYEVIRAHPPGADVVPIPPALWAEMQESWGAAPGDGYALHFQMPRGRVRLVPAEVPAESAARWSYDADGRPMEGA